MLPTNVTAALAEEEPVDPDEVLDGEFPTLDDDDVEEEFVFAVELERFAWPVL